jgi:3-deoxy-D-manno-octulosonic-acid transferase
MLGYRLFIWLYPKAIRIASIANPKARLWIQGRKHIFRRLSEAFTTVHAPVIWMHAASLGEFEQGLPVLEQLKTLYPSHTILVTFFSPSGYEIRKSHPVADKVFYLPMDSAAHAKRFLDTVKPQLVLFVKYEFWYHYLHEIQHRNIPLFLISGIFRREQAFFKWYGAGYRKMLSFFSVLFVQNEASLQLLASIGLQEKTVCVGDTRFDRVLAIAGQFTDIPVINHFCGNAPVVVAGSTWTDDDEELDHFANTRRETRFIVAPHDIGKDRLDECMKLYHHAVLFSEYQEAIMSGKELPAGKQDANVLIMDNMGMLSRLYHYATIAYVGGGFGEDGIHNILEPAVFGKPVIFGPVYDKYFEAEELLDAGAAFTVEDALELENTLTSLLQNSTRLDNAGKAAADYVKSRAGTTGRIIQYIQANRLLIS